MSGEPDAEPELEPPWIAYPWIQYGSTAGAEQLIALAVVHGALPPPWLAGHPPRDAIADDIDRADDVDRCAWWLFATVDDPASWRGYLARQPPPPAWQAALARDPYRELDRNPVAPLDDRGLTIPGLTIPGTDHSEVCSPRPHAPTIPRFVRHAPMRRPFRGLFASPMRRRPFRGLFATPPGSVGTLVRVRVSDAVAGYRLSDAFAPNCKKCRHDSVAGNLLRPGHAPAPGAPSSVLPDHLPLHAAPVLAAARRVHQQRVPLLPDRCSIAMRDRRVAAMCHEQPLPRRDLRPCRPVSGVH